jgi:hypothetical protein
MLKFFADALDAMICALYDVYSFLMTSRALKIVSMVSIIIFACIGIGIVYYRSFPKNNIGGTEQSVNVQMVEPAVPKTSPPLKVESKSDIAVPIGLINNDKGPKPSQRSSDIVQGDRPKGKEPQSATAPDRKKSGFSIRGKKMTVNPVTKFAGVKSAILKVALQPLTAEILLDGKAVSAQDVANGISVQPGPHVIAAQAPGFEPYQAAFTVEPGEKQTLDVFLTQAEKAVGLLHVYSYPWSDLYVDGVLQGTTPTPKPIAFQEGDHALQLKRKGFKPYSETIHIQKGQVTRVQINLEKSDLSEN